MTDSLIVIYIYILLLYTYVTISVDSFIDSLIAICELPIINYQTITINPPPSPYMKIMAGIVTTQKGEGMRSILLITGIDSLD